MRVLALLFLLTAAAAAQNLTGAWKLVSAGEWRPNGEMLHPYGKNPTGQLLSELVFLQAKLYDAKGQVSLQVQGDTYFAWFGAYKMDQTNGMVHHTVQGSTMEKLRKTTVTCFVTMDGNRLTLGLLPEMVNGEMRLRSLVWERIP
jgi:hypothetical protein